MMSNEEWERINKIIDQMDVSIFQKNDVTFLVQLLERLNNRVIEVDKIRIHAKDFAKEITTDWNKKCETCGANNCKSNEYCIKCTIQF